MLQNGQQIDKYRVIRSLGQGHFGEVYHVMDNALRAEKALKVIKVADPRNYAELIEAQIQHRCRHQYIVQVNEANVHQVDSELFVFIDMEYLHLGSLQALIESQFIKPSEVVKHIRHALFGLAHAHHNGVLHRDIKPGNILLSGTVTKIADFGLATPPNPSLLGSTAGYWGHCAPEAFSTGTSVVTDIFSMGITLYRTVNQIENWAALLSGVQDLSGKMLSGKLLASLGYREFVPPKLRRIINKACHTDPTKRYQSCSEMGHALDKLRVVQNWERVSMDEWKCQCGGKTHRLLILNGGGQIEYLIDDRRKKDLCARTSSYREAQGALQTLVAARVFQ